MTGGGGGGEGFKGEAKSHNSTQHRQATKPTNQMQLGTGLEEDEVAGSKTGPSPQKTFWGGRGEGGGKVTDLVWAWMVFLQRQKICCW